MEGAVYDLCRQALEDGETVLERFGYSDDDAFAVGLTCGGVIDILVTPVRARRPARPVLAAALAAAAARRGGGRSPASSQGPAELLGRALLVRPDGAHRGRASAASPRAGPHGGRPRPAPCSTPAAPAPSRSAPDGCALRPAPLHPARRVAACRRRA